VHTFMLDEQKFQVTSTLTVVPPKEAACEGAACHSSTSAALAPAPVLVSSSSSKANKIITFTAFVLCSHLLQLIL